MKLNERGLSLVEALVGLGIAAGISVVLMQQQETSSKMQTKNNANQVVNSAANIVQSAVSNRAVCSYSLAGKKVGDSIPALIDAQVNPANYNQFLPTGKPNLADLGQELPGSVKIQDMKIVTEGGKDFLSVVFNVNPTGAKKMFGAEVVGKKFQLQGLKAADGKYISCHSELSNLVATACMTMPGGVWNATTQSCELNNFVKKTDLSPLYLNGDGVLTSNPPEIKNGEQSCQKNGKKCSRTDMDCTASCPGGQMARNEREWDRCQQKVFGACVDWACMKTVDCISNPPPVGFMVKP